MNNLKNNNYEKRLQRTFADACNCLLGINNVVNYLNLLTMVAEHLHEELSAYIKANIRKRDIDIGLHFGLTRQDVANFRNNILKLKKIRNYYHKDLYNPEARQRIGEALEVWVSSGYSSKVVTEKTGVTINKMCTYITQYYLPKRLTEQTEVITLQSRI